MSLWLGALLAVSAAGMALEAYLGRGRRLYHLGPTLSNLGCGLLRGVVGFPIQALLLTAYAFVHQRFALTSLDPTRGSHWLLALVGYDFLYYWAHRVSHHYRLLWAGHAVHHQPDEMNLSVLFRAPVVALVQTFPIYLLLAIAGVPPLMYATVAVVVHASMFWLHTRLIPDLPLVACVLETPSLHRIHHSTAHHEGTSNFGGLFSLWDRLFATHRAPSAHEPERYGIQGFPPPRNPFIANVAPFRDILAPPWRDRPPISETRSWMPPSASSESTANTR